MRPCWINYVEISPTATMIAIEPQTLLGDAELQPLLPRGTGSFV